MPSNRRRRSLLVAALAGSLTMGAAPLSAQEQTGYGAASPASSAGSFEGSVPAVAKTPGVLALSLRRAIDLGLDHNLGLLLSRQEVASARARHWQEFSRLLPNLSGSASAHRLQESLAITGISFPGVPAVVGPFNFYDARIFLRQRLFDLEAFKRSRAAALELSAAQFTLQDAREQVVVAVGQAYLEALSGFARVASIRSQVVTARTILDRAVEFHKAGVTPGIDELRAKVEWLNRSQLLIVAENDLAKQKLSLIRLIGLPVGQEIALQDQTPYRSLDSGTLDQLLSRALGARDDYRAAASRLQAAEASRQAAGAQRLPSLTLDADYGLTGLEPSSLRDTYHVVGNLTLPIFQGGKIHGDVLSAEARVRQRRDELADLGSRIEFEVRVALLDAQAASRQVAVSQESLELAELDLYQAQERFAAGVDDNMAVVQAQQSVATANESLIASRCQLNLAKLLLARALGRAEEGAIEQGGGA